MENISQIKKVLKFYFLAHGLKNKEIGDIAKTNFADNIFGSMIIAIAMNSEFKETNDLGKVLKMLALNEIISQNPDYCIVEELRNGKKYLDIANEFKEQKTKEAKLAFKYRMMEYSLNAFLSRKYQKYDSDDLKIEQFSKGQFAEFDNEECFKQVVEAGILPFVDESNLSSYEKVYRFYAINYRLKRKTRAGWDEKHWNIQAPRLETVAQHSFGTFCLALALDNEFGFSTKQNFNIDEVLQVLPIHEVGENIVGDITPYDGISKEEKAKIEHEAMKSIVSILNDGEKIYKSLVDFDEHKTEKDKFTFYCDKMDADITARDYFDNNGFKQISELKGIPAFKTEKAQKIIQGGIDLAYQVWLAMDQSYYKEGPIFRDILNILEDNGKADVNANVIQRKCKLNIDDYNYLVNVISEITKRIKGISCVNSIFMNSYIVGENNKIVVTVLADRYNNPEVVNELTILRRKLEEENKTGVKVVIVSDDFDCYSSFALNPSEVMRIEKLDLGTILFDKTGELSEIKNKVTSADKIYGAKVVYFEPPIEEAVLLKLKDDKKI